MDPTLLLMELIVAATLARALLVHAKVLSPMCARCGDPLERRTLGEKICSCSR